MSGSSPIDLEGVDTEDYGGESAGTDPTPRDFSDLQSLQAEEQFGSQKILLNKNKGHWSKEEDGLLVAAVGRNGGKNWKKIAEHIPNRSDVQCLHRWQKVLNPTLVKGPWTDGEDY